MDALRLYFRYVGISVRSQMQYRASFLLGAFGQFLLTGLEFVAIWALFERFHDIDGWRLPEVALLYGIANVAFALAEGAGRGFDVFARMVKSGDFDRLLLRPRSTVFQVAASEVQLLRVGRLAQGAVVLGWALVAVDVDWNLGRALLLLATIVAGICVFVGLWVLQATFTFWTTEGLEVANVVTYGGVESTQYPISIYRDWLRGFLTFLVPLALVGYYPVLALTGRTDSWDSPAWLPWAAPLVGPLFLGVCLYLWRFGVRHYRSTGS